MKVKYLGYGPGQAPEIVIGGFRFSRGETYDIPADDVKRLRLDREGFEVASGSKKKADKETE